MPSELINNIFKQYLNGSATQEDLAVLVKLFQEEDGSLLKACILEELQQDVAEASSPYQDISNRVLHKLSEIRHKELLRKYANETITEKELKELQSRMGQKSPSGVNGTIQPPPKPYHLTFKKWIAIAASLLLFGGLATICYKFYKQDSQEVYGYVDDVKLPNHSQAVITFDDGKSYVLLQTDEKVLAARGIHIMRTAKGEYLFKISDVNAMRPTYQTFHSPKGTLSRLMLPDGTMVWLNSDAKLRYPLHFAKNKRAVELDGEAYFEVTHNAHHPFTVSMKNTHINVLGTAFNVAANLRKNAILTTLVEGSVEVETSQQRTRITPGMQAVSDQTTGEINARLVNTNDVLAWKDGYFRFREDDIYAVMEKIKSWYDIEEYQVEAHSTDRFTGLVLRTHKLSDLLDQLEKISVYKFKIKDRRVYVMR
ncbi:FecR family protein [Sphingobacterium psychroaquaticum]|uniref:FecR family protein n=1 Tax=Sphingobacterium psychroaquaticum TaxID=561061 RepID=UPI00106AEE29|nr:FecR family protein [Sphingobacterium psychroaquaticum]QBQ40607.1 FecR family protein [Sphingobacterium psychroaquaticum]